MTNSVMNIKSYIFGKLDTIDEMLDEVFYDIPEDKLKNIELNDMIIEEIRKLEFENYLTFETNILTININGDIDYLNYILNEYIHKIYEKCSRNKFIDIDKKIDSLVQELEEKENECRELKNKINYYFENRL